MAEGDFVTREECERRRQEFDCKCDVLRKEIGKEHDTNIKQDARITAAEKTLDAIKKIGWFIATTGGATLVASLLNLILK